MEDILQVMTLEQARQVIVDDGICKGMTIAQVAEKRPVNLRYYLIPGKSKNNNEGRNDRWARTRMNFPSASWRSWNCCTCGSGASRRTASMWTARSAV